jgi:hypothetical protein
VLPTGLSRRQGAFWRQCAFWRLVGQQAVLTRQVPDRVCRSTIWLETDLEASAVEGGQHGS